MKVTSGRGISIALSMAAALTLTIAGTSHADEGITAPTSAPTVAAPAYSTVKSSSTCSPVPTRERASLGARFRAASNSSRKHP